MQKPMQRCARAEQEPPNVSAHDSDRYQNGVSLMESLIAVVVLAAALLGMLGMQMRTLTNTQDSVRRTQAIRLIDDLSERMKAQPDAIGQASQITMNWDAAVQTTGLDDCATTPCTAKKLIRYEANRWLSSVKENLPLGQARVFSVTGDPRQLGVMLAWRVNDKDAADSAALLAPPSTGEAAVHCPEKRICHLQYISLTRRCLPIDADTAYCVGP